MAKKSKIAKNEQRKVIVARYAEQRLQLKKALVDPAGSDESREAARLGLQKLPRDASPVRLRNRDAIDGRPRGHIGEFGIPDNDPRWLDAAERLQKYLALQCMPLTYWSSGPYWGGYFMAVEPINGQPRPQWTVMGRYLKEPKCKAIGPT